MSTSQELPPDRSKVITEGRHPETMHMDKIEPRHVAALLVSCSEIASQAVSHALPQISAFIDDLIPRFEAGGRLIMVGAGTSGRLAVAEATEMPPTFQLDPERIVGLIAGGNDCLLRSSEGLEDETQGAWSDLKKLELTSSDTLLGITAGGSTPYVHGALAFANSNGALTGLLTCAEATGADHVMLLPTGPEPLTGSTRMNAGTATKIALNTITTTLMVATGRVYENLMVDLNASNDKLRDRAARILMTLQNCHREDAFALLESHKGSLKAAIRTAPSKKQHDEPAPLAKFLEGPFSRILCLDGGGTKTAIQLLSDKGELLQEVVGGPLNIHDIGEEGVRQNLSQLLHDIDPTNTVLVAGVAGAERTKENATLDAMFAEHGFEQRWVRGDGDLLLDALHPTGAVLIAGSGSHCIGQHKGRKARAGGLGRILGDEGSGYWIGLEGVKRALASRYGWGEKTALLEAAAELFEVDDIEQLLHPINNGIYGKAALAKFAPKVLQLSATDPIAQSVVDDAIGHLTALVRHLLRQLDLPTVELHLIGGLFRHQPFVDALASRAPITPINLCDQNPIAWAAGISHLAAIDNSGDARV